VDDSFELLDPGNAQSFLQRFKPEAKRRGGALFRSSQVQDLVQVVRGLKYSASVQDGGEQTVSLNYHSIEGWEGQCSCPKQFDCEHIFAAMSAVLAEHRTAAVRRLSAGDPGATAALAFSRGAAEGADSGELSRRLIATTGRPLGKEETTFLRQLRQVFKRCTQTKEITAWDFQQMGFPVQGAMWGAMHIWPALPRTEYEFWLYVAHEVERLGLAIPDFMLPVTDLKPLQKQLARWQRVREIDKWKQTLGNFQSLSSDPKAQLQGETDIRLVIDLDEFRLEWLRPGQTNFEAIKQTQLRQLSHDYSAGLVRLTPEGEVLLRFFLEDESSFGYGPKSRFSYDGGELENSLGRALRLPFLNSRMVTPQGQALARPVEPLRWQLTPATTEEDDYRFSLVQADGSPAPSLLSVLEGNPALYLTSDAVYAGPDPNERVLDPTKETRIPAPALERTAGVAFLDSIGVELPPRVRERVRTVPFQVTIACELRPAFASNSGEDCIFNVVAEAPDGHKKVWEGYNWVDETPKAVRKREKESDGITVYDSAQLAVVPGLLETFQLKRSGYGFSEGLSVRVTKKFPETFALWVKTVPPSIVLKLEGDLASLANADVAGSVKLDVAEADIDWFDLRVVLNVADTTLTKEEIKLLLNAKGGYVRLKGKGWRRLQYDLTDDENERLAQLGLSPRELSAEPQRLHALQLAHDAAKKFLPAQQVEQIQRRADELKARVSPDLPLGVTAQLRPYQLDGFHFLAYLSTNRFGGILADDMGLGKTLQTLAWLLWLRADSKVQSPKSKVQKREFATSPNGPSVEAPESDAQMVLVTEPAEPAPTVSSSPDNRPSIVICPKSVMDNWHAEAARFTPELRVKSWPARELEDLPDQLGSADLHVLNYSQLRMIGEALVNVRWLAVILDEGQYIKNPTSQTAAVARALRAEHRLILSGTPIENRLLDLWSLMSFSMPGVLGNRNQFGRLYDSRTDPLARRRLASRVRPFVLRRTKSQVAKDLPDRIEEDLFCEIEGEQKTLYRAELKHAQQLLLGIKTQQELAKHQFHFLTSLLRLRQICCHPRLMNPDSPAASAKLEALLEQLEPLMDEGQKVLVFSQFVEMLDLIRPALAERNWPMFYLSGETENRGQLVKDFQSAEGPAVFLISLKAGGFGLNLTAASYVVLFDPWWNPAVENQAIDRTHRIGQTNKVIAYRLLIKNSIEEKIRELQKQKKALAEDVLGEARFAQSLTLEDLRFLFAD
jgi:hypothetical protein